MTTQLFHYLQDHKGSDLHLAAGLEPRIRVHGSLEPLASDRWPARRSRRSSTCCARSPPTRRAGVPERGRPRLRLRPRGLARFRANFLRQENGPRRRLPHHPGEDRAAGGARTCRRRSTASPISSRGWCWSPAPPARASRRRWRRSSTRSTAPTSSHIVTIEDPVEFVHPQQALSSPSARWAPTPRASAPPCAPPSARTPTSSWSARCATWRPSRSRSPRPRWARLVFGTLHTNCAANTIDRLIDAFPAEEQSQIRTTLAESLAGVVSQLLLRTADGKGRCAVNEILLKTARPPERHPRGQHADDPNDHPGRQRAGHAD